MSNGYFKVEMPKNEPVKAYLPGSPERASLKKELERQSAQVVQVLIYMEAIKNLLAI